MHPTVRTSRRTRPAPRPHQGERRGRHARRGLRQALRLAVALVPVAVAMAPAAGADPPDRGSDRCQHLGRLLPYERARARAAFYGYVFAEGWFSQGARADARGWAVVLPFGAGNTSWEVKEAMVQRFLDGACAAGYGDVVEQLGWSGIFRASVDEDRPVPLVNPAELAYPGQRRAWLAAVIDGEGSRGGIEERGRIRTAVYDEQMAFHHDWYGLTPRENAATVRAVLRQVTEDLAVDATTPVDEVVRPYDLDGSRRLENPNSDRYNEHEVTVQATQHVEADQEALRRLACSLPILRWDRAPGNLLADGSHWDGGLDRPSGCG